MSKFKVEWIGEVKEITGKFGTFKKRELTLPDGVTADISEKHPAFHTIRPGDEIEGEMVVKGNYKTIYPSRENPFANKPAWAQKNNTIAKAQETKREDIKVAQENRKEGVMIASTARDATQIALAELSSHPLVAQDFQDRWDYWQKWLAERWKTLELGF